MKRCQQAKAVGFECQVFGIDHDAFEKCVNGFFKRCQSLQITRVITCSPRNISVSSYCFKSACQFFFGGLDE